MASKFMNLPLLEPGRPVVSADLKLPAALLAAANLLDASRPLTVLLNDPQRATRSRQVLGPLLAERTKPVRVLVATGSHHFPLAQREQFHRDELAGLTVEAIAWHDCDDARLVRIGSWRGHPWLLETDWALLAIGSCEMHYFAGITGAHKTATIGCMDHAGIQDNHRGALSEHARPGRLEGNPVHEGVAACLAELEARRPVVAVNLLQAGAEILAASAGSPLEALEKLVGLARQCGTCGIPQPADALVLRVSGPLARSLYQAEKAIKNSEWAVRDGGLLVLDAPCPQGVGQDDFLRLLRECPTHQSICHALQRQGYRLGDHKAVKLRYLTDCRKVRVCVVSQGVSPGDAAVLGFVPAASDEEAIRQAGLEGGRVWAVPDAANVCVEVNVTRAPSIAG